MTRLIEILIALAIVGVLFVVVGLLLPSERHLVESAETNRKMTIVYDTLTTMRRFDDWNPVVLRGQMETSTSGPEAGEGATFSYDAANERVGEGSWTIVEAVPGQRVVYAIEDANRGEDKRMTFLLEPTGRNNRNVKITQQYSVDYGWNILGRYEGLYVSRNVGDAMKLGLKRLTDMLATVPNYDYSVLDEAPEIVERPAQNLLFVPSTVDRDNDVVMGQMKTNWQWIEKVMQANGLERAGPLRIVTVEFGSENYAFEVTQPVRKAGTGPDTDAPGAEGEAAGADGEEAGAVAEADDDAGAADAPRVDAEPIEVALQGPVEYRHEPAHRAVTAHTTGHMANLPTFRDGIRAWALTRGYETTGRPYETWNNGIDAGFSDEGDFDVYWPVKD